MFRGGFLSAATAACAAALLASCTAIAPRPVTDSVGTSETVQTDVAPDRANPSAGGILRGPGKIALLAPQSGASAAYGTALLQAAQLAVFDIGEPQFQLIPEDTKGTPDGTRAAVDDAARNGAKLTIGPLFAQEVEAAKAAARGYGLTVIGFSTDWKVAGDNAFTMGVLPFDQVERIATYASRQNLKRVAVIAASDAYGDAVTSLFQSTAPRHGVTVVKTLRISADGRDVATAAQMLAAGGTGFDAIFMPVGGQVVRQLATALRASGFDSSTVRYLGTGLWDDTSVLGDPNMAGAVYAAPAPQIRAAFERNYQRIYGQTPPRLASLGYDATALAVTLARNAVTSGSRNAYDRAALLNPNGFSGVDGIFRFRGNGLVERGMAILQISQGRAQVIENAPASFQ